MTTTCTTITGTRTLATAHRLDHWIDRPGGTARTRCGMTISIPATKELSAIAFDTGRWISCPECEAAIIIDALPPIHAKQGKLF